MAEGSFLAQEAVHFSSLLLVCCSTLKNYTLQNSWVPSRRLADSLCLFALSNVQKKCSSIWREPPSAALR